MNISFDETLSKITPEVSALIWVTKESIVNESEQHELINYLIDGELYNFIQRAKKNEVNVDNQINLLSSHSFDNPFFVLQIKEDKNLSSSEITNFKKVLQTNTNLDELSIIILGNVSNAISSSLNKAGIKVVQ